MLQTKKYRRDSWQSQLMPGKATEECLCMFDKHHSSLSTNEYIDDQKQTIATYLGYVLRCTKVAPLNVEACTFFDLINVRILNERLPEACELLLWTASEEFKSTVFAKTFVSDYNEQPYIVFNIVISSLLVTDIATLLKVILHEIAHCVQHLDGKAAISHGTDFRYSLQEVVRKVKLKKNRNVQQYFVKHNCTINKIANAILNDL